MSNPPALPKTAVPIDGDSLPTDLSCVLTATNNATIADLLLLDIGENTLHVTRSDLAYLEPTTFALK
jgi:hypothetical protein